MVKPSATFQQLLGKQFAKAAGKSNPVSFAATETIATGKAISREVFGYDFVGLIIKLAIYFIIAYVFAKFMEAVVFVSSDPLKSTVFKIIFPLLGLLLPKPTDFPKQLTDLFDGGLGGCGLKFWDIIKILAIILVIAEVFRYMQAQKELGGKGSPLTFGVFTLIIIILGVTTVPELIERLKGCMMNKEQMV